MSTSDDQTSTSHIHVSSLAMNLTIFGALMLLTMLTVWAAFQDFGPMDTTVALAIAVVKATLVVLFFMHVAYSSKIVMMCAASGFLFLVFLFAFPFADLATRPVIPGWPDSLDVRTPLERGAPELESPRRETREEPAAPIPPEGV